MSIGLNRANLLLRKRESPLKQCQSIPERFFCWILRTILPREVCCTQKQRISAAKSKSPRHMLTMLWISEDHWDRSRARRLDVLTTTIPQGMHWYELSPKISTTVLPLRSLRGQVHKFINTLDDGTSEFSTLSCAWCLPCNNFVPFPLQNGAGVS